MKASNNDGIWNDQGTSIRLHVEPPPWQTPWAYSLYSLFFGGTVVGYRRKQNKKLNQVSEQKQLLESEVEARTRELSERNDELKNLNQRLMQASVTDSLTGLKNRRFLDEFIATEIARVDRRQHGVIARKSSAKTINISPSLFFMMIDLDGFKPVNDKYGHAAGDAVFIHGKIWIVGGEGQGGSMLAYDPEDRPSAREVERRIGPRRDTGRRHARRRRQRS